MTFAAQKYGKIRVSCSTWDDYKVVLEGEVFEVRWGVPGGRGGWLPVTHPPVEEPDPFRVPDAPSIAPATVADHHPPPTPSFGHAQASDYARVVSSQAAALADYP